MTPGFDQKVQKSFPAHHYPHLTLSLPDRTMDQSFLDYLNLLLAQGVTLDDAGKSGLVQNEQSLIWNGLCCWRDNRVWRIIGELKVLQTGCRYIFLHLREGIFHWCHSWHHFVKGFLQSCCCRQRFRGYLCDFNLLLIYCYIRNWDCVHNRGSCILDWNMLSIRSQGRFIKAAIICTWHWCHRWKLIPLLLVCSTELISKQICKKS